jgi:site-specific recombinase XerC
MNQLVSISSGTLPAAGNRASMCFLEFFAANIHNPHTRRAYYRAAEEFLAWCADAGVRSITAVQPVHVATWIEASTRELAAPSVKQRLAALRHLFAWLVNGQVVPVNPSHMCAGLGTSSRPGRHPCSIPPKRARCSIASMSRHTRSCATVR